MIIYPYSNEKINFMIYFVIAATKFNFVIAATKLFVHLLFFLSFFYLLPS